jgi:hypothetical protein
MQLLHNAFLMLLKPLLVQQVNRQTAAATAQRSTGQGRASVSASCVMGQWAVVSVMLHIHSALTCNHCCNVLVMLLHFHIAQQFQSALLLMSYFQASTQLCTTLQHMC